VSYLKQGMAVLAVGALCGCAAKVGGPRPGGEPEGRHLLGFGGGKADGSGAAYKLPEAKPEMLEVGQKKQGTLEARRENCDVDRFEQISEYEYDLDVTCPRGAKGNLVVQVGTARLVVPVDKLVELVVGGAVDVAAGDLETGEDGYVRLTESDIDLQDLGVRRETADRIPKRTVTLENTGDSPKPVDIVVTPRAATDTTVEWFGYEFEVEHDYPSDERQFGR
jgi:hypothetical protein